MRVQQLRVPGLVALVCLGALLRLAYPELTEFRREEAWALLKATDMIAGRGIPLTGIETSVPGLDNGPFQIYITSIALLGWHNASVVAGLYALLNVGALLVAARLAALAFGQSAMFFAVATYAVGSWAVYFSRKIWPNDLMPLFSALLALALIDAIVGGRRRGLILGGFWLGILVNLHPSGLTMVPVAIMALALRPRLLVAWQTIVGVLLALATSAPFIANEVRHGFPAIRALRGVAGTGSYLDITALLYALDLVGPGAYRAIVEGANETFQNMAIPVGPIGPVMAGFVVLGVLACIGQIVDAARTGRDWRTPAILLICVTVPVALAVRRSVPLWNHYFIFLLPFLFVILGNGLAAPARWIGARSLKLRRGTTTILAAMIAITSLIQIQHFVVGYQTIRTQGDRAIYGAPWGVLRSAADTALVASEGLPLVLVSQVGPHGLDDLIPMWRFLIPGERDIRFDDGGGVLRLTSGESLYIVGPTADPITMKLLSERGKSVADPIALPGGNQAYRFWFASARAPDRASRPIALLADGLALEKAHFDAALVPSGQTPLTVVTDWRVTRPLPEAELAFFTHMVDDRGRRIAGSDRGGVAAGRLGTADEVRAWATIGVPADLAPGRYWLETGAYWMEGTRRLRVVDGRSLPVGDSIRLGPLKVPIPAASQAMSRVATSPLAQFGPSIALDSFSANQQIAAPASSGGSTGDRAIALEVELNWRAIGQPERDLTVFVHLLAADGKLVTQDDRQPRDGSYPTSIWSAGEQIRDRHVISAPPGLYRIVVGLYDPANGARLARSDTSPRPPEMPDAVELRTIDLRP